jgi:HEAT repeat protein
LSIAKEECLPFVAAYLSDENDGVRDFAALALGESRHPQALDHLRAAWDAIYDTGDFRAVLIRAAALNRTEAAFDWLISIIEHDTSAHAEVAVEALSVYERNMKLNERVQAALAKRKHTGAEPSRKPSSGSTER